MSAVVVVPLAVTDDHRDRAWNYVSNRLAEDGWPVVASDAVPAVPWCKATATADALDRAPGRPDDVLIIHDADVVVDLAALRGAVAAIETSKAAWAIPHHHVLRLSEHATDAMFAGEAGVELVRQPYIGIPGGGIVVLFRAAYEAVPLDRRFVGWGDEDQSWGWALGTLFGAPWRETADLVHLWHPPARGYAQRRASSFDSNRLRRAYRAYRSDVHRMRALVDGAR